MQLVVPETIVLLNTKTVSSIDKTTRKMDTQILKCSQLFFLKIVIENPGSIQRKTRKKKEIIPTPIHIYNEQPNHESSCLHSHDKTNVMMTPCPKTGNDVCICKNKLFYISVLLT